MKIFFSILAHLLFIVSISGQPIITESIVPQVGDQWNIKFLETNNFNPGNNGANQTWDFSGLDISNSIDISFQVLNPTSVIGHENFPTADFVMYLQGFENYQFYAVSEDSISLVGGEQISGNEIDFLTIYTDPEDGLHLPVHYGDSYDYYSYFEQYFAGNFLAENDRNGSVTADAYGTIITPNGTYSNVLRLIIEETSFGETNTQYAWYDVNHFNPVLLYETSTDMETPNTLYYTTNEITSVIDATEEEFQWEAWSDAASNQINIELPMLGNMKTAELILYNMEGRTLGAKTISLGNTSYTFDVPNGVNCETLLLQLKTNKGNLIKKVWVCKE